MSSHNLDDLQDDLSHAGQKSAGIVHTYLEEAKGALLPTLKKSFIAIEINKIWVNIPQNSDVYDTSKTTGELDKLQKRIADSAMNLITKGRP